jgi:transposase
MSPTSVPIFQRLLPRETHGPTAQLFDLTVSFECTLKQPLFSQITIGNVLCSGAAAAGPSRAIDVVWNVAELDRGNRPGHTVRLMAPQFVKPYVKTNKNDVADAEAICEAVSRPNMRFVPIKSIEQQAILSVHRVRQGFVKARSAQGNQIRGLLGEFGLVIPQGIINVTKRVPEILEDASNELPVPFRHLISRLTEHLKELDRQVKEFEKEIIVWHRSSELSRKLEKIPGIGPLAASALVASIADARSFKNGRQVSAWLGLVPRQSSSGGKPTLLGMSKRGDAYLRTLLIHGARSAILAAKNKVDNTQGWLTDLLKRRHPNIAAVALANKNVRTVWAILAHGREFEPDYVPTRLAA